jgi:soluble lytic murein transglycosylase
MKIKTLIAYLAMALLVCINAYAIDVNDHNLIQAISNSNEAPRQAWEQDLLSKVRKADRPVAKIAHMLNNIADYSIAEIIELHETNAWLSKNLIWDNIQDTLQGRTPQERIQWFAYFAPQDHQQRLMLLDARFELNNDLIKQEDFLYNLRLNWRNCIMEDEMEEIYRKRYAAYLTEYDARVKMAELLWEGKAEQAELLQDHLKQERFVQLYKNRIAMTKTPEIYADLPAEQQKDDFILYSYMRSLLRKEDPQSITLLAAYEPSTRHDKWMRLKNIAGRDAVRLKTYDQALKVLAQETPAEGKEYYAAQWLQGWIYLRQTNQPEKAIKHFFRAYNTATMAYSRSQAAYWLGRTFKKLGNEEKKTKWFNIAGKYAPSFYAQLANREMGRSQLPTPAHYTGDVEKGMKSLPASRHYRAKLVNLFYKSKQNDLAYSVYRRIKTGPSYYDSNKILAAYFVKNHAFPFAVILSKQIANYGQGILADGYPTAITFPSHNENRALYLSLIRQESNFDQYVISKAGAVGLMQLMPFVAEKYAERLNLPKNSYIEDINANAAKGATHIDDLLQDFNKTHMLAIAAYNAGSNPAKKWIARNGNPRDHHDVYDNIDWIELISYGETRMYVAKVLENLNVYNHLLCDQLKLESYLTFE